MEKFRLTCILLVLNGLEALGGKVNFTNCPSQQIWTTTEFDVSDCADGSTVCDMKGGKNYTITVTGYSIAAEGVSKAKPFVATIAAPGTNFGLPIFGGDLCDDFQDPSQHCPITSPWNGTFVINYTAPPLGLPLDGIAPFPVQLRAWKDRVGFPDDALVCMQYYSRWVLSL